MLITLNNFKLLAHRSQKYPLSISIDWNVSAPVTEPTLVNQALSRTNVNGNKISDRFKGHSVYHNNKVHFSQDFQKKAYNWLKTILLLLDQSELRLSNFIAA